jgi:hypothetical protein
MYDTPVGRARRHIVPARIGDWNVHDVLPDNALGFTCAPRSGVTGAIPRYTAADRQRARDHLPIVRPQVVFSDRICRNKAIVAFIQDADLTVI